MAFDQENYFYQKPTVLKFQAVNVKIHGEIPHASQCLSCVVIVGCWKKNISQTSAKVKTATKSCNFFYYIAAKLTAWKAIFRVLPLTLVQLCLATSEIVASCVNTDFWLNNITRKSIHTQDLRHLLQNKFALGQ